MIGQSIPRTWVSNNVRRSYLELKNTGMYFSVSDGVGWDGWTEALLLNTIVTEYDGNLLEKAIANAYSYMQLPDESPLESLEYIFSSGSQENVCTYTRYWAGCLTLYKFLLIFVPLSSIRSFLLMVVISLLVVTLFNIHEFLGRKGILSFLISILICMYIPNSMCLVFAPDIIIMLIAINICCKKLRRNESSDSFFRFFLLIGSLCIYINYWSFPLITLGIPLIFWNCVRLKKQHASKNILKDTIITSVCWSAGLGATVLIKQVLSYILFGSQSGLTQLKMRMGADSGLKHRFLSVFSVINRRLFNTTTMIIIFILIISFCVLIELRAIKLQYNILSLLLIASYPIVWCLLLTGHNGHGFIDYMYGITYYALLSAILLNCDISLCCIDLQKLRTCLNKKLICSYVLKLCIWFFLGYAVFYSSAYYHMKKIEPASLSGTSYISLDNETHVVQEVLFDFSQAMYLENLDVILVNIIDKSDTGTLCVKFMEDGKIIKENQLSISKIIVGEWTKIPIKYVISPGHTYQVDYSVKNCTANLTPYLLTQESSQKVPCNTETYVNDTKNDTITCNIYEFKELRTIQKRLYIVLITLLLFIILCDICRRKLKHKSQ